VTKLIPVMPIRDVINFIWFCLMIFVDAQTVSDVTVGRGQFAFDRFTFAERSGAATDGSRFIPKRDSSASGRAWKPVDEVISAD
jgi:hypothetical protein